MALEAAQARDLMVETQVRTNDVTDVVVLEALRRTPREAFVDPVLRSLAYSEAELPCGEGRVLWRPRDLGKMLQALLPRPGEKALVIAPGTGYPAAVLVAAGLEVHVVESTDLAAQSTSQAMEHSGFPAQSVTVGDLLNPPLGAGPFDLVLIGAASEVTPPAWLALLQEGGRLGLILREKALGRAQIWTKSHGGEGWNVAFDAAPPLAPEFKSARSFVF